MRRFNEMLKPFAWQQKKNQMLINISTFIKRILGKDFMMGTRS